ncbi:MAG TPA: hypothetical protein PL163_01695 [Leptospiraceae bacterium]|nr:hypothetical protein [Leptospiraceae bacterium]
MDKERPPQGFLPDASALQLSFHKHSIQAVFDFGRNHRYFLIFPFYPPVKNPILNSRCADRKNAGLISSGKLPMISTMKFCISAVLFLLLSVCSVLFSETFFFPGGKLEGEKGVWTETKTGTDPNELLESWRDEDWILLYDAKRKIYLNVPVKGGQSFQSKEEKKNLWKPYVLLKKNKDKNNDKIITPENRDKKTKDPNTCLNAEEAKLVRLLTELRVKGKLPAIQTSSSLTALAKAHTRDIQKYPPAEECSLHSWSSNGNWSSCCYKNYAEHSECMLKKPGEITDYKGEGYEIIIRGTAGQKFNAQKAYDRLKADTDFIDYYSRERHEEKEWSALGISLSDDYIIVWFGKETDTKPVPAICEK